MTAMKIVALLCVAVLSVSSAMAEPTEMVFEAHSPNNPPEIFGNAWAIYATGPIDGEAASRLSHLIAQKNIPPRSSIYFSSPGGRLFAAMQLGSVVRKNFLFTDVLERGDLDQSSFFRIYRSKPGVCFSACTLAYLGGVFRFMQEGSAYGVHRFFGNVSL
jgi:hypothetical protein